jgi:ankyrin repeat protein
MNARRRRNLLLLSLLIIGIGAPGWLIYRQARQARLDSALIAAAKAIDVPAVTTLLAQGADANARDVPAEKVSFWRLLLDRLRGRRPAYEKAPTALLVAVDSATPASSAKLSRIVNALLAHGANPNVQGEYEYTTLMWVASSGDNVNVANLLAHGADVRARDDDGRDALESAVQEEKADIGVVRMLQDAGADLHNRDSSGATALMIAMGNHHPDIVSLLIARGADVNASDNDGDTPLMYAALADLIEEARLLLRRGANVNVKDNSGNTSLSLARANKDDAMARLLLRAGAKR